MIGSASPSLGRNPQDHAVEQREVNRALEVAGHGKVSDWGE